MTEPARRTEVRSDCDPPIPGHCSMCGDEAVPAVVLELDLALGIAEVATGGRRREVALDLVEGVEPGDTILIHQGFAIARMPRP